MKKTIDVLPIDWDKLRTLLEEHSQFRIVRVLPDQGLKP